MRCIETTLTVDSDGTAHLDQPLPVVPGRHRAVVVVDETIDETPKQPEAWPDWLDRMNGALAGVNLERYPQGDYEQRETIE